jgi:hypothetical protein
VSGRRGTYEKWVQPLFGHMQVRTWGATPDACLAHQQCLGRRPLPGHSGQRQGPVVHLAPELRWLPEYLDPLGDEMVEALALAVRLAELGQKNCLPWVGHMGRVAAYGGLRYSERTALTVSSYRPETNEVMVACEWSFVRGRREAQSPTRPWPWRGPLPP